MQTTLKNQHFFVQFNQETFELESTMLPPNFEFQRSDVGFRLFTKENADKNCSYSVFFKTDIETRKNLVLVLKKDTNPGIKILFQEYILFEQDDPIFGSLSKSVEEAMDIINVDFNLNQ